MAKNILEIAIKLTKQGGGDKETVSALIDIKNGLSQLAVIGGTVAAAYATVDKVLDATVGKFVSYAGDIRTNAAALSLTAEETSRLTQVLDNFGISIDSVQNALFTARKNGIDITVDGLANMADAYNAIESPQQKALYLQENLGKQGKVLAEVFAQGGDAIRAQNSSIQAGLILDQKAIDEALKYEQTLDDLNDAKDALAITTGQKLIPAEIEMIDVINRGIAAWQGMKEPVITFFYLLQKNYPALAGTTDGFTRLAGAALGFTNISKMIPEEIDSATRSYMAMAQAAGYTITTTQEGTNSLANISADYSETLRGVLDVSRQLQDVEEKRAELNAKLAEAVRMYGENSKQAQQLRNDIADLDKQTQDWTNQFIFGLMQAQLAADGVLSEDDITKLLTWGEEMGVVADNALATYNNMVLAAKAINGLPANRNIAINVRINTSGDTTVLPSGLIQNNPVTPMAEGGTIDPKKPIIVGDIPGQGWGPHAEVIIDGQVIPHNEAQVWYDLGLLDNAPAYATGKAGKGKSGWGSKVSTGGWKKRTGTAGSKKTSSTTAAGVPWKATPTTTEDAVSNQEAAQAYSEVAAISAAEAVSPVVIEAVQSFQAAQTSSTRENTAQVARQTAAIEQANATQTAVLQNILVAIEGQAEKLTAEMQKH